MSRTYEYVCIHDSFICVHTWFIHMCRFSLQGTGTPEKKLYVSFAKQPYKRDYILQKRPIILRSHVCSFMTRSCATRLVHICDTTHSHVPWLIHMWHDSFMCYMPPIHMRAVTYSYVWHEWHVTRVPWLNHMCGMRHDSFTCVTWVRYLIHMCGRGHVTNNRV